MTGALRRLPAALFGLWIAAMLASAYLWAPGLHDNDFPLLVWLGRHAEWRDLSTITIGHYSPIALLMLGAFSAIGNTLVLAKALNLACVAGSAALVSRLARRLGDDEAPAHHGLFAAAFFLLSAEVVLVGQSEFGDPPVVVLFLLGLDRLFAGRWLAAGIALGGASLFRIYAPSFVLAAVVLAVALRVVPWRKAAELSAGVVVAAALQAGLYWLGQRRLSSPIAEFVVGQVLYRYDEFNYLDTWNEYPIRDVLRLYRADLVALVVERLKSFPPHLIPALVISIASAVAARRRRPALLLALAFVYYGAYACLSWGITTRLMLLPVGLFAVMVGASVRGRVMTALATVAVLAALVHSTLVIPDELASVRDERTKSAELTRVLRDAGLRNAREAFVFDWDRSLTDDPTFEPYYNFGFWNILSAKFRAERPSPFSVSDDPVAFSRFLREHGAKFVVFRLHHWRFPALMAIQQGEAELPGFERIARLPFATVYRRVE
jgi:hypothetical protein